MNCITTQIIFPDISGVCESRTRRRYRVRLPSPFTPGAAASREETAR